MKRHTTASTALLGIPASQKSTTFRHLLNVLSNDEVTKAAATSGLQRVHHDLSQTSQIAAIAVGPGYMDTEVPKEMHQRFEEFVVCFKDKNPAFSISVFPN